MLPYASSENCNAQNSTNARRVLVPLEYKTIRRYKRPHEAVELVHGLPFPLDKKQKL
jgi:hypothetical protein